MSAGSVENLIESLTDELQPMKRLAHPLKRVSPWLVVVFLYVAAVVAYIGLRSDFESKYVDTAFLFEVGIMLATGITAALAAIWMCVPDMRGQKWMMAVPLTLLSVFVIWSAIRAVTEGAEMPHMEWSHCFTDAMMLAFLPAAFIAFLTMKGASTRPHMSSFMSALAASAFGYVGLRFTCPDDTMGHNGLFHIFPYVVLGGVFGAVVRRMYRW